MDLYICENCFAVRELAAGEKPPVRCPACNTSGPIVEAYLSDRFARKPAQAETRPTGSQM